MSGRIISGGAQIEVGVVTILLVMLVGCAGGTSPSTQVAASSSSASVTVVVPPQPCKARVAEVLVNDSKMVFHQGDAGVKGPNAYAVVGDQVIVVDQVNSVFASYVDGKRSATWPLPSDFGVVGLVVRGSEWFVLDGDNVTHIFAAPRGTGKRLKKLRVIRVPEVASILGPDWGIAHAKRLRFEGENLIAVMDDDTEHLLEGPGPLVRVKHDPEGEDTRTMTLTDGPLRLVVKVEHENAGVDRYEFQNGRTYYEVGDAWNYDGNMRNCVFLYEFNANYELVHTYTSIQDGDADRPAGELVVADGKVYRMVNSVRSSRVELLNPNP